MKSKQFKCDVYRCIYLIILSEFKELYDGKFPEELDVICV